MVACTNCVDGHRMTAHQIESVLLNAEISKLLLIPSTKSYRSLFRRNLLFKILDTIDLILQLSRQKSL